MSQTFDQIVASALKLSDDERAILAAELLATLDPATPGSNCTEDEWIAEIERRAREALAGATGIPWEQVRGRVKSLLRKS